VLDLHLSWIDEEGKVRFDAIQGQAANKGLVSYTPHTTGAAGMFYRQRLQEFYRLEEDRDKMKPPGEVGQYQGK
jgi:hypothetical protein